MTDCGDLRFRSMLAASRPVWRPPLLALTAILPLGMTLTLWAISLVPVLFAWVPALAICGRLAPSPMWKDLVGVPIYAILVGAFLVSVRVCWAFASGGPRVADPRLSWAVLVLGALGWLVTGALGAAHEPSPGDDDLLMLRLLAPAVIGALGVRWFWGHWRSEQRA